MQSMRGVRRQVMYYTHQVGRWTARLAESEQLQCADSVHGANHEAYYVLGRKDEARDSYDRLKGLSPAADREYLHMLAMDQPNAEEADKRFEGFSETPLGGARQENVTRRRTRPAATVGVVEHGNSAVLVTVAPGGDLLDRRRIDLTHGLPALPHHHEGSWAVGRYLNSPWARPTSLADAVALVERVRESAARGARESLEALAESVSVPITSIAIRVCPTLPPTTEARIADNRAQTVADSVMYREALATAGQARGWSVHWYDRERVFRDAAAALGRVDIDAVLHAMGRPIGPPWQAKQKLAAAAALACRSTA